MKKTLIVLLILMLSIGVFAAGSKEGGEKVKVGMVTDAGTIDDKSFNQGTWEGILRAQKDFDLDVKYLKPNGTTEADYLKEISNLYDAGYKMIVCPGFKFETAIYAAQNKYKDATFVLIDGNAHPADSWAPSNGPNTIGILYLEHESGFLAGLATALELKSGAVGFVGGMEIPAVQKFNWGFQQGVAYANKMYGTTITLDAENVIYQGTFSDVAAGQQLAAAMYDKGLRAIFAAAGGVGVGVINEAKSRAEAGKEAWVIGVDVDQYDEGKISNGKSIILTSSMKRLDVGSYDQIQNYVNNKFEGGKTLVLGAKDNGVSLPKENPNLSKATQDEVANVYKLIQEGKIVVAGEQGNLIR